MSDTTVLDDLIGDLTECKPHDVMYAGDLLRTLLGRRSAPDITPEVPGSSVDLPVRDLDLDYLDRLEAAIHPETGDLTTTVWRFEEGEQAGKVAIWQCKIRGDDLLALIRIARSSLQTKVEAKQPDAVPSS